MSSKPWMLSLILFLIVPFAVAEEIYVELTATSGVSSDIADTVTELVKSEVKDAGEDLVEDPAKADYTLAPSVLKLGNAIVLKVDKIKKGKLTFSSKLKANSVEELDTVAQRVTQAVIKESSVDSQERVGKLRESEVKSGALRKQAAKRWYLGFGPALASNLGTDSILYDFEVAYTFDINRALMRLFWDSAFGEGASAFGMLGLGVQGFSSDADTALTFGGDFGYGYSKREGSLLTGESTGGFGLAGGIGYSFFRTSSINLELMFKTRLILKSNSLGSPLLYTLKLGIYF